MTKIYNYIVDLNERDSYYAHVEDAKTEKIVYQINNEVVDIDEDGEEYTYNGELWITEDGFMRDIEDMQGLKSYLADMKVIPHDSVIHYIG